MVSTQGSNAVYEDLDAFQLELEYMLTDAMKRLRLLKNEHKVVNIKPVCLINMVSIHALTYFLQLQNKYYEDRLKKLKDSNYEKYQLNRLATKNAKNLGVIKLRILYKELAFIKFCIFRPQSATLSRIF